MRVILHMGDPYTLDNPCSKRIKAMETELRRQGHEVWILAPDTPGVERQEGVVYCKTAPLKKKTTLYRLLNQGCLAISSLIEGRKIRDVDVVLTTCPPPLISISGAKIAKKHRAKLIYDVRDIWPDVALEMGSFSINSIYSKVFSYIRDYMLRHADLITAVSKGKVKKLKAYAPGKKVITISNGYNITFNDNSINQELYNKIRAKGKFVCSYIGNIGLAQGIQQLLDLAERAMQTEIPVFFVIYGSGAEEEKLKQYVKEKKMNNISFEGRLPNKEMRTVLEASDMNFVSLVNGNLKDSIPTKLYEALGVGCPVLLAAEGDAVDILNETQFGIAVKTNDSDALWNGFKYIYENLDEISKNRERAIELMNEKHSLQESAIRIVEEMKCLCKEDY